MLLFFDEKEVKAGVSHIRCKPRNRCRVCMVRVSTHYTAGHLYLRYTVSREGFCIFNSFFSFPVNHTQTQHSGVR